MISLRVQYGSRISGLSEFHLNELKSYYSDAENNLFLRTIEYKFNLD